MANRKSPRTQLPVRAADFDETDLRIAESELAAGREMLVAAHATPDRLERDEAMRAAIAKLALASRAIDEVVDRRSP